MAEAPFKFERPVLIGESPPASVTGSNYSHFWFPEAGGVVGKPGGMQAVVVGVRFNGDGGAALPKRTYESLVSYDHGSSWAHLGWTPTDRRVFGTYRVTVTGDGFTVTGVSDVDNDGQQAVFVATRDSETVRQTAENVY